jgi:hypothetical protein
MYLNNRGIGLAPVVLAGLFALAICEAAPNLGLRITNLFPKPLRPARTPLPPIG